LRTCYNRFAIPSESKAEMRLIIGAPTGLETIEYLILDIY
jgi:hypothetical protein